jgi:hypothetical protein
LSPRAHPPSTFSLVSSQDAVTPTRILATFWPPFFVRLLGGEGAPLGLAVLCSPAHGLRADDG